jgi:hypothetical protein
MSDEFQLSHRLYEPYPLYVTRRDQTIVAWEDVPEHIQKKILSGTMTEEDWGSDWDE